MEERARRVKSLLEGYYGTGGQGELGADAASALAKNDINGKGFDPDSYVSGMIKSTRMDELLQQHVNWAAEIKNLDSDMQMLVYENYSKFISATDTIKKMKDNIGGMESTMDKLLQSVTTVQERSDSINSSLCERRERIEQLNGTRSLLRKTQYIFDLPKRLRQFASAGNHRAAVKAYKGSLPILESYGETSFKLVREEAEEVMARVAGELQAQVMSDCLPVEQRAEAAMLMQQLDQPVEALMDSYLALHWGRLLRQLREAADAASRARDAGGSAEAAVQQSLVDTLNRDFVEDFERTASNFRGIFPAGADRLTASTRELFNEYVAHVQATMQGPDESNTKTSDLMFALRNLARDVGKMSEQVPGASLAERAAEAMEAAVRDHIVQSFALQELRVKDVLESLAKPIKAAAALKGSSGIGGGGSGGVEKVHAMALEGAEAAIVTGTLNLLEDLHQLLGADVGLLLPSHDSLVLLVHGELSLLLSALHDLFFSLSASGPGAAQLSASMPPTLVLLFARLSQILELSAIAKISAAVDGLFPLPNSRLDASEDANGFYGPAFVAKFHAASERLLQQYVDMEGKKLCVMIGKSVSTPNWLKYKEPKDVRMVIDLILQEADTVRQACAQLLGGVGDGRALATRPGMAGSKGGPRGGQGAAAARSQQRARSRVLERDVAKLFKQKVEIFTRLEFSQASVLSTLLRMLLKSFQECVRLQTFGRNGYRQIQLDALFLCDSLRCLADDGAAVDALMDEVCTAAAERSVDPTPMDPAAIDRILQARRERRGY